MISSADKKFILEAIASGILSGVYKATNVSKPSVASYTKGIPFVHGFKPEVALVSKLQYEKAVKAVPLQKVNLEVQEISIASTPGSLRTPVDSYKLISVSVHLVSSTDYLRKNEKAKVENFLVEIIVCPQAGMLSARIDKD